MAKRSFRSGRQSDIVGNIGAIMISRCKARTRWRCSSVWLGILTGLVWVCAGHSAGAANIRGRLVGFEHLRNPVWAAAKDPDNHGYSFREPVTTVPAAMRKLFPLITKEVCVVALGTGTVGAAKPVSVRISGGRTTPVTLVVVPGTELRFKNSDPFDHRLYGVGFTSLAPSTMSKGATRRWTALEAGRYEIRDEFTPSLTMWVIAEPTVAAAAFPSSDGRFTLSVDEPGQYTLQAYFAGEAVGKAVPVVVERRDVDASNRPLVLATKAPVEDNNP